MGYIGKIMYTAHIFICMWIYSRDGQHMINEKKYSLEVLYGPVDPNTAPNGTQHPIFQIFLITL